MYILLILVIAAVTAAECILKTAEACVQVLLNVTFSLS